MKYRSGSAFRTALEHQLRAYAAESGAPLIRLRKRIVFERLLARLQAVAPGRWVLKGGFALDRRFGLRARLTQDLDLARDDDESAALADFLAAQAHAAGDFFEFSVTRTDQLDAVLEGTAVRYRAEARLGGRLFERLVIDVGFSDPLDDTPDLVPGDQLLRFAGVETLVVPTLRLDRHVAEKLHAYSRVYGVDALASTRVKDLVDLALLATHHSFDASQLQVAIEQTFAVRATSPIPRAVPPPPRNWEPPYRRLAEEIGLEPDLNSGHTRVAALLDPILARLRDS